MTGRVLGIAIVAALAVGGCAREPGLFDHLIVQPDTADELGYTIAWQTPLGLGEGERLLYVEQLDDRLVTVESGNILAVLNADSGQVLWRAPIGRSAERFSRPRRAGGSLIICSETRAYIYDIDHGDLLDTFSLAALSGTTPTLVGDLMIHGSPDGRIYAQDLRRGLRPWQLQTGGAISTNPLLVRGLLLVANANGDVIALDPRNGQRFWERSTFGPVTARPVADDRHAYVASEDQSLYAYSLNNGRQVWRYFGEQPLRQSPVRMEDLVLVNEPRRGLIALEAETGEVRWSRQQLGMARPFLLRHERLYVHRPNARLVEALALNDGESVRSIALPAVDHVFADDVRSGNLYAVRATTGRIMKLEPR